MQQHDYVKSSRKAKEDALYHGLVSYFKTLAFPPHDPSRITGNCIDTICGTASCPDRRLLELSYCFFEQANPEEKDKDCCEYIAQIGAALNRCYPGVTLPDGWRQNDMITSLAQQAQPLALFFKGMLDTKPPPPPETKTVTCKYTVPADLFIPTPESLAAAHARNALAAELADALQPWDGRSIIRTPAPSTLTQPTTNMLHSLQSPTQSH